MSGKIVEKVSNIENKYVKKEIKTTTKITKDHYYEYDNENGEKIYTTVKTIKTLDKDKKYIITHEDIEYNNKKYTERN